MNLPLLASVNASENAAFDANAITPEPFPTSTHSADSDDETYSSIRVEDPGQIETLLSRYDLLLHEISTLDHQIQCVLKELAPPVALPA
jgi:hypothetical protein